MLILTPLFLFFMDLLFRSCQFMKFFIQSRRLHGIHSPFVYQWMEKLQQPYQYYGLEQALNVIEHRSLSNNTIQKNDLGTGRNKGPYTISVKNMARKTRRRKIIYRIIFELTQMIKPSIILELGTGLGFSTLVMAQASPNSKIISVDGCKNTLKEAGITLQKAPQPKNIQLITASFDDFLQTFSLPVDLVFIDGNHTFEATTRYAEKITPLISINGALVLDDIHWSKPMYLAWQHIRQKQEYTLTLDFFDIGILFKNPSFSKEEFKLLV